MYFDSSVILIGLVKSVMKFFSKTIFQFCQNNFGTFKLKRSKFYGNSFYSEKLFPPKLYCFLYFVGYTYRFYQTT